MFNKFKEDTTYIRNLEDVLKERINGRIVEQHIEPLTKFGENFGSEILKVDVTVEEKNGEKKVIHAVGKMIPPTQEQLEIFNTQVTFKNEIAFYAEIVPALQKFQKDHGIEPASYFPEFYGARTSLDAKSGKVDNDAVILMENLKLSGYGTMNSAQGFDLDSIKIILSELADFQATATALRLKNPDIFKTKILPYLTEWKSSDVMQNMLSDFIPILRENSNTSALTNRVKKILTRNRVKKIREPWGTISHNDLWVNNIMVKESRGTIDSLKFVDFQITDYSSPLVDVIFILFTSVPTSVLRYHFEKLLQHYYKEFINVLQKYQVNTKDFTYESFQEELAAEGAYQIYHAYFMLFVVMGPKEPPPKPPGKVPEWNPDGKNGNLNGGQNGEPIQPQMGPPQMIFTPAMKERIWFIAEEAARRNWI